MQENLTNPKTITAGVCALEVIKKIKLLQIICVFGIGSVFITVLLNNFILSGGLSIVVFGYFLYNSKKEETELKNKYGI